MRLGGECLSCVACYYCTALHFEISKDDANVSSAHLKTRGADSVAKGMAEHPGSSVPGLSSRVARSNQGLNRRLVSFMLSSRQCPCNPRTQAQSVLTAYLHYQVSEDTAGKSSGKQTTAFREQILSWFGNFACNWSELGVATNYSSCFTCPIVRTCHNEAMEKRTTPQARSTHIQHAKMPVPHRTSGKTRRDCRWTWNKPDLRDSDMVARSIEW